MRPATSVLRSRQPLMLTLPPGGGGAAGPGGRAARGPARVAREATVVGPGLPILEVQLEAEHGLDTPDSELEVRTEPGSGVPLLVTVASEVAVVGVSANRRYLVDEHT